MTDLEKRAKDYANKWLELLHQLAWEHKTDPKPEYIRILEAYKDGATQETALLSQHIIELQKDKGNLTDKVRELEQQIEKMKDCRSCKHDNHCNHRVCDKSLPFWELRR